tara:strand:+ start:3713 stop:4690 length:978 start_codon:yes stop_codon:yes gene_type:complete
LDAVLVEEKVATVVTSSEFFCNVVLNSGKVAWSSAKLAAVHVNRDVVPSVAGAVVAVAGFTFEDKSSFDSHIVEHVANGCEVVNDVDGVRRNVLANDSRDDSANDELDGSRQTEVDLAIDKVASFFGYVEDAIDDSWETVAKVKDAVGLVGSGKGRARTWVRAALTVAAWSTGTSVASESERAIVESLAGTRSGDAKTVDASLTSFEAVDALDWVAGVGVVLWADTNVAKANLRRVTIGSHFTSATSFTVANTKGNLLFFFLWGERTIIATTRFAGKATIGDCACTCRARSDGECEECGEEKCCEFHGEAFAVGWDLVGTRTTNA